MKRVCVAVSVLCLASAAHATEYLGLDLGAVTKEKAADQLKAAGSAFEDNYGYKGYGRDLPVFKVSSHERFSKLGRLEEAWLEFSPKGVLYKLQVTYADAGETFKVVKDALDAKYKSAPQRGFGFNQEYKYRDGKTDISLLRNTFGFGADQKTTLVYVWTPLVAEVNRAKAAVDEDIKKKNARKAGSDL